MPNYLPRFLRQGAALIWAGIVVALTPARQLEAGGPIRLSGTMVTGGDVDPTTVRFTPDGNRVLYLADQTSDTVVRLFSVPANGGTVAGINGSLVTNGDVIASGLFVSGDSSRVVYRADQVVDEVFELFSVPITGGVNTRLNGTLVVNGDVDSPVASPDGTRMLYRADQTVDERFELYEVPFSGGTAIRLNPNLVSGGDITIGSAQYSPDGNYVVYHADQVRDEQFEAFVVPRGGAARRLNGTLVTGGDVDAIGLRFSPDSSSIVYRADQRSDEVYELFRVPVAGGDPVLLNGPLPPGGDVDANSIRFSPNSANVLYLADQDTDGVNELYVTPSDGSTPRKLNGPLVAGGNVSGGAQFSPDGSQVLFTADANVDDQTDLFIASVSNGPAIQLNPPLVAGGKVDTQGSLFSQDGSLVVYRADQINDETYELFAVPSGGGDSIRINSPLVAGGNVTAGSQRISPDGSRVLYRADQSTDEMFEAYLVPTTGGTPVRLNGPLPVGGDVADAGLQFSPDGTKVAYVADQNSDDVFELFTRVIKQRFTPTGGSWDTASNWDQGTVPDEVMQITINGPSIVTADGSATTRIANQLSLGGGIGNSILELRSDASLTLVNGITVSPGSVVRGRGHLDARVGVVNVNGAEFRTGPGERLRITSPRFLNMGKLEALGTSTAPAEMELTGSTNNSSGTGLITGQNSVFRFEQGLTNSGALLLSTGINNVTGDILNLPGGRIVVAGGATVTFYDDVVQNGSMQVISVGGTPSSAVFAGSFTGSGGATGGGNLYFLGDLRPGNSPAFVTFNNNVALGASATLDIEIGGTLRGTQYDVARVNGTLSLDGTLNIQLVQGYHPQAGAVFHILEWQQLFGQFASIHLPPLQGLEWNTSRLYSTGDLLAVLPPLPGDFNGDRWVDLADFTAWRDGYGTRYDLQDYATWKRQYGQADPAPLSPVVPEPNGGLVGLLIMVWTARRHHRRGIQPTQHSLKGRQDL